MSRLLIVHDAHKPSRLVLADVKGLDKETKELNKRFRQQGFNTSYEIGPDANNDRAASK